MPLSRELSQLASVITVKDSNKHVGIGSTTPTAEFDVAGSVKATSFLGDGSNLTGIDTTVSESDVTAHQAALSITESQISDLGNYATLSYVNQEVAGIVSAAPATLDTLNELAAALGDDANFSTTVTNQIAQKANISGAQFTGIVTATSFSGDGSLLTGVVSETLDVFVRSKSTGNILGRTGNIALRPVAITVTSNTIDVVPRSGSDITVIV